MKKIGLFFLLCLQSLTLWSQDQLGEVCITEEEYQLYLMVDNLRKANELNKIPLSKSLTYIAQQHARDLYENRPQEQDGCTLHSWSDKGKWTVCCFDEDYQQVKCMNSKPSELTSYTADGWELAFQGYTSAQQTMTEWEQNAIYKEILINKGGWDERVWAAMGVAVYKGYAVVWFGEDIDNAGEAKVCEGQVVLADQEETQVSDNQTITTTTTSGTFYIVYGSYNTMANASKAVSGLQAQGYSDVKVIQTADSNRFRVSLGTYNDEQTARSTKAGISLNTWLLILE